MIYLPPDYGRRPLPVIELLHGSPGDPTNWLTGGDARQSLDAFAAAHDGAAPIVVMPDINGATRADSECVRAPDGSDVEQYLVQDLPRFMSSHFGAPADHRRWSVVGLSEGGTCAIMLALRHPAQFAVFGDLSGLARPTVGVRDHPAATIAALFGGSVAAYNEHDPLWLLSRRTYPTLAGWFACGIGDGQVRTDQARLTERARAAGITVRASELLGRHDWDVWSTAFRQMLPWIWQRTAA